MATEVIMPALGMAQETGKVLRWLKSEGDVVAKGEPLLEIETDKVTVEVESPAAGTLGPLHAGEGDDVPVGQAVAFVFAAGEPVSAQAAQVTQLAPVATSAVPVAAVAAESRPPRRRLASPKARRLAEVRGIDIETLAGSGPNGAVLAADVQEPAVSSGFAAPVTDSRWRTMAERMTHSWQTVPHFHLRRTVDASRLQSWREAARRKPGGETISITDLLVKLVAEALRLHPRVNATWTDGSVVLAAEINVGIAVATEDALVVPVVHAADQLELSAIAARRSEIVTAAREGRLRPSDVARGTFTISNLGMYGVDGFDAIVNTPQAAILAVGRIVERIVPLGGQAVIRPMLELSIGFDHRVVDGARGAEFLNTLAALIEEPAGLVR